MSDIDEALEALSRLHGSALDDKDTPLSEINDDFHIVMNALERQRELTEALRTTTDYLAWGSVHIPGYAGVEITRQVMANEKMLAAAPEDSDQ